MHREKALPRIERPLVEQEIAYKDGQIVMTAPAQTPALSGRRLKVLFVPEWYPTEQHKFWGTFCREHVHAAALYENVAVLAFTSRLQRWPTMQWEQTEDNGVPTFRVTYGHSPIPKTTLPFFYFHLRRALGRVLHEWGHPDVIHTQDTHAYHVMKALWPRRIPVLMSQHWTAFMERTLSRKLIRQYRCAFQRAARVLPDNKFAASEYQHYGLQAAITWLPNTIDTQIFRPPLRPVRQPWLLHASTLLPQKRFPDVVHAFARVRRQRPEAVLHVVGESPNRAGMEALAARELPSGSFRFHGYFEKPDLAELMRQASGFVLPSVAENLPCVLIEAMACGCPVLSTRVGGIPDLVREGGGLLVDVGNIEQIAEGMCKLLDGTHGFDMAQVSHEIRQQYSRAAVGRILHEEHLRAAHRACPW
jgi:glycosyltransferase involved in cell wall biosynthesis